MKPYYQELKEGEYSGCCIVMTVIKHGTTYIAIKENGTVFGVCVRSYLERQ